MAEETVEVTEANLEQVENESSGYVQTVETEPTTEETTLQTEPTETQQTSKEVTTENQTVEKPKANSSLPQEIADLLKKETPYTSVDDIIKGYKNSQSEFTKFREKFKPHEQLVERLSDPKVSEYVRTALDLLDNPMKAQAYLPQKQAPNPLSYDLYNPEDLARYNQDLMDFGLQSRLAPYEQRAREMETQRQQEVAKQQFKSQFPDADADGLLQKIAERNGNWSLGDVYKALNYDTMREQLTKEITEKLSKKVNEAQANTSASNSSSAPSATITNESIANHAVNKGMDSAYKKFGRERVDKAIEEFTNQNSQ